MYLRLGEELDLIIHLVIVNTRHVNNLACADEQRDWTENMEYEKQEKMMEDCISSSFVVFPASDNVNF